MQIDNLTDENVTRFKDLASELSDENPALETRVYPMDDQPTNAKIFEKLESIERLLNMIFDGHVLIEGGFRKIDVK